MIFISIFSDRLARCLPIPPEVDGVELRLDSELPAEGPFRRLRQSGTRIMITSRPGKLPDTRRKRMLLAMLDRGVEYLDLDLIRDRGFHRELTRGARQAGVSLVLSFHDYRRTPPRPVLVEWVRQAVKHRADLVKVVTMIRYPRDIRSLLGLYECLPASYAGRGIFFGMGQGGRITRLIAPFLGCPIQYVTVDDIRRGTAPGQWPRETYRQILEECGWQKKWKNWR